MTSFGILHSGIQLVASNQVLLASSKAPQTRSHKQAANLNNSYPFLQNCVCSKANTVHIHEISKDNLDLCLRIEKTTVIFYSIFPNKYNPYNTPHY